ncbi:unnamed protein product [Arabidopsis halleri]
MQSYMIYRRRMGLKMPSNTLLLSLFLVLLCLFSEIGGSETSHRRLGEVPIRELTVGPSCSCGGKGQSRGEEGPCPRPSLRPCPP